MTGGQGGIEREEIAREQAYVELVYAELDQQRARAQQEQVGVLRGPTTQGRDLLERDARVTGLRDRRAALDAAEDGLCFGRLDTQDGERCYIGRIGLRDSASGDPLLLDWRADAARPFYVATPASPEGVRRRRHLTVRTRRVLRLDDELLGVGASHPAEPDEVVLGEGALLAALTEGRTGRMNDIVATLQREQDEAVRSSPSGALVVQGGPGTGKTAVALHRTAYLLYTHPQIARRGVLIVGPSPLFLSYVSEVLPGLGETRAVLSTIGELFPGVIGDRFEPAEVATLKGDPVMAEVIAAAVADRQGTPEPASIEVDGDLLSLSPAFLRSAVHQARAGRLPHNQARLRFHRLALDELARQALAWVQRHLVDVEAGFEAELAAADRALAAESDKLVPVIDDGRAADDGTVEQSQLARELAGQAQVQALLEGLWPQLTAPELLADLFADPHRLDRAAGMLPPAQRELLCRPADFSGSAEPEVPAGGQWSEADIPLLDEAAELLGRDTRAARARAEHHRAEDIAYAQGVLDISSGSSDDDTLGPAQMLAADTLADRHDPGDARTLAERAVEDRTWAYGHVVVDEAQELSAMAWRMLIRRCPTGSMTVVGDLAQRHSLSGAESWTQVLAPHVGDRLRVLRLNVNYRTPMAIMEAAIRVLAMAGPGEVPPQSVRGGGEPPWRTSVPASDLASAAASWAEAEVERIGAGRIAVLVPESRLAETGPALTARLPAASCGVHADLRDRLVVLSVGQAKGLEFDSVLVVDPGTVLAGPHGPNDLYVAMTRSTRALGLLCQGPVPEVIAGLEDRPAEDLRR